MEATTTTRNTPEEFHRFLSKGDLVAVKATDPIWSGTSGTSNDCELILRHYLLGMVKLLCPMKWVYPQDVAKVFGSTVEESKVTTRLCKCIDFWNSDRPDTKEWSHWDTSVDTILILREPRAVIYIPANHFSSSSPSSSKPLDELASIASVVSDVEKLITYLFRITFC